VAEKVWSRLGPLKLSDIALKSMVPMYFSDNYKLIRRKIDDDSAIEVVIFQGKQAAYLRRKITNDGLVHEGLTC
jgi:hypothetical protein